MQEELNAIINGVYFSSFMQIKVEKQLPNQEKDGRIEVDELVDQMTDDAQRATLLHEYIHYLQNISTPFGLFCSMIDYLRISEDFAYAQSKNITEKDLPINPDYSETVKRGRDRKIAGLQMQRSQNGNPWPKIDKTEKIINNIEKKNYNYFHCDIPYFIYKSVNGTEEKVYLGAWIIYEYMSALFQSYINKSASHPDVPYNILDVFLSQSYPDIYKDKAKIVALLYMSLFDMNPGLAFVNSLDEAIKTPQLTATEMFDNFMNNKTITDSEGNKLKPKEFFQLIINKFKKVLESLLQCELDYIEEILNRVNMDDMSVPLITIISDGVFNIERMKILMKHLGIPYLYSEQGGYYYPASVKNEGKESNDMIGLIGVYALDSYLRSKQCKLSYLCKNGMNHKPECNTLPWNGETCVMTGAAMIIGILPK